MTRDSAITQMNQGNKVTHERFSSHEYLWKVHGKVTAEDGYYFGDVFNSKDFFFDGWTLYVEPKDEELARRIKNGTSERRSFNSTPINK